MAHGDAFPEESTTRQSRRVWDDCYKTWCAWRPASSAPKDGSHILVCCGPYSRNWTFNQRPPAVVHYWANPGEEGFYLSHGLTSETDTPFEFTHWRPTGGAPRDDHPKTTTSESGVILAALKSAFMLPRPWVDHAVGRAGTISEAEWNAAYDAIETAIAMLEGR